MSGRAEILFTFGSTHHAIASEQALVAAGVPVRVLSLPSQIRAGCGLCLRVWPEDRQAAARALARAGLSPQEIWQRDEGPKRARYTPLGEENG